MSEQGRLAFDSGLWFQWIMATALGWLLGKVIFRGLPAISAGVGVGILQWPILYRRLPQAWRWPLVTAVAWIGGSILMQIAVPSELQLLLAGLILGPIVGLAQWLVLRQGMRWAGWWIIICTIAWITGLTLLPGILATGAMVGALSGIALSLLLPTPRQAKQSERRVQNE
jgi:hypothetical protein